MSDDKPSAEHESIPRSVKNSGAKCAYCRGKVVAKEPRKTDDGYCCWQCWQRIE